MLPSDSVAGGTRRVEHPGEYDAHWGLLVGAFPGVNSHWRHDPGHLVPDL